MWEDLFSFIFPDNDKGKFNDDEYFLGPIVTFKNDYRQSEIIDGQQRLTTLLLLLRAFYDKFENMKDEQSITTKKNIAQCLVNNVIDYIVKNASIEKEVIREFPFNKKGGGN